MELAAEQVAQHGMTEKGFFGSVIIIHDLLLG
jgi:hypothetical protein